MALSILLHIVGFPSIKRHPQHLDPDFRIRQLLILKFNNIDILIFISHLFLVLPRGIFKVECIFKMHL